MLKPVQRRHVGLFITHLSPHPRETFTKAGMVDLLGADAFRQTVAEAMSVISASR